MVENATKLAKQFEQEMVLVETIFTVMSLLEILVDVVTFYDLQKDNSWFDAGTFAGKGLINAGFTTFYVTKEYFIPPKNDNDELVEGAVDL